MTHAIALTDVSTESVERLGIGRYRLTWRGRSGPTNLATVQVNDCMTFRGKGGADIRLSDCEGMSIEDITILHGGGFCIHETGGEGGHRYLRVKVTYGPMPREAEEKPLIACNADAFHSSGVRKGPTIEKCSFEGMPDDGVAIHGFYGMVFEAAERMIVVAMPWDHNFLKAGDPLRFFDAKCVLAGEAKVIKIEVMNGYSPASRPDDKTFKDRTHFFKLETDQVVTAALGWRFSTPAANGSGYVVRDCSIRNHRARGLLLKADDGLVEGNTIDGSTMAGIVLAPELYWNEACFSRRVMIRKNTIRRVGYQNAGAWMGQAGAITIAGEGSLKKAGPETGHEKITIEENRIENCDGVNLLVWAAKDVVIRGNRFEHAQQQPSKRGADQVDSSALIQIGPCAGVRLEGNVAVKRGSAGHSLLKAAEHEQIDGRVTGIVVAGK